MKNNQNYQPEFIEIAANALSAELSIKIDYFEQRTNDMFDILHKTYILKEGRLIDNCYKLTQHKNNFYTTIQLVTQIDGKINHFLNKQLAWYNKYIAALLDVELPKNSKKILGI